MSTASFAMHRPQNRRLETLIARAVAAHHLRTRQPVMLLKTNETVVITCDLRFAETCPSDVVGTFAGRDVEDAVQAALQSDDPDTECAAEHLRDATKIETDLASIKESLLRVASTGHFSERSLYRACHPFRTMGPAARAALLTEMVQSGQLVAKKNKPKRSGPPVVLYSAARGQAHG